MKKNILSLCVALGAVILVSCNNDTAQDTSNVVLQFNNTFKNTNIVLGGKDATTATTNTSEAGQIHRFSELKYVVSNIRLVTADGREVPYHANDLDRGATVINQAKPQTLQYVLENIPAGEYKQLKFGLGVKPELNTLDQERFPKFYAEAGANDTKMMWEWGTGYRFTKIEGFYDADNKELSIHTGSTEEGTQNDPSSYVPGVNAYRDIQLSLPQSLVVGERTSRIIIQADFDKLLSGKSHTIVLDGQNATPNVHTALNMEKFVDNLGGNGTTDVSGMFSVQSVEN